MTLSDPIRYLTERQRGALLSLAAKAFRTQHGRELRALLNRVHVSPSPRPDESEDAFPAGIEDPVVLLGYEP